MAVSEHRHTYSYSLLPFHPVHSTDWQLLCRTDQSGSSGRYYFGRVEAFHTLSYSKIHSSDAFSTLFTVTATGKLLRIDSKY